MGDEPRMLDWRAGGWVVALALVIVATLVAWRVVPWLSTTSRAVGDGREVDSYGFDLADLDLPRDRLAAAGFPRDGVPALGFPTMMAGAEVGDYNRQHRGKYLVSTDLVVGVVVGGEARAYPLRVLNWHEVVNDTVGGVPIAVTYHPLSGTVVAIDRRIDGRTVEFGVSGLLYNSNHLLYDRTTGDGVPSLWNPLLARAVSGPAAVAGISLRTIPVSLARWGVWLAYRPDTGVVRPADDHLKRYRREPYGNYYVTDRPRYPVEPRAPEGRWSPMERLVIVVDADGAVRIVPLGPASGLAPPRSAPVDEPPLRFDVAANPPSVIVDPATGSRVIYALWFAWYAFRDELRPAEAAS